MTAPWKKGAKDLAGGQKVAKAEWGMKRICPHCGTRYYDMKKKQPVCPSCGTVFDPESLVKSRRGRAPVEEKAKKAAPLPEEMEGLPLVEGEDADAAVIEDADELADDVDVEEVVDVAEVSDKDDI